MVCIILSLIFVECVYLHRMHEWTCTHSNVPIQRTVTFMSKCKGNLNSGVFDRMLGPVHEYNGCFSVISLSACKLLPYTYFPIHYPRISLVKACDPFRYTAHRLPVVKIGFSVLMLLLRVTCVINTLDKPVASLSTCHLVHLPPGPWKSC